MPCSCRWLKSILCQEHHWLKCKSITDNWRASVSSRCVWWISEWWTRACPCWQGHLTRRCEKPLPSSPCCSSMQMPMCRYVPFSLRWRHIERDVVSNHQPHDCSFNHLFRRRSKKTSKVRVIGLYEENSPVTGEFPAQRASHAEKASIWWRHHVSGFSGVILRQRTRGPSQ